MSDKEIEVHKDRCKRLLNDENYETCHFAPAEIQNFLNLIEQLQQIEKEHRKLNSELRKENNNLKQKINKANKILKNWKSLSLDDLLVSLEKLDKVLDLDKVRGE